MIEWAALLRLGLWYMGAYGLTTGAYEARYGKPKYREVMRDEAYWGVVMLALGFVVHLAIMGGQA